VPSGEKAFTWQTELEDLSRWMTAGERVGNQAENRRMKAEDRRMKCDLLLLFQGRQLKAKSIDQGITTRLSWSGLGENRNSVVSVPNLMFLFAIL